MTLIPLVVWLGNVNRSSDALTLSLGALFADSLPLAVLVDVASTSLPFDVVLSLALTVLTVLLFVVTGSVRDSFEELLVGSGCWFTAAESAAPSAVPVPTVAMSMIVPRSNTRIGISDL